MSPTATPPPITALYRCPACNSEYPTVEQAQACQTTPTWPKGTKYVTGRGRAGMWCASALWEVRCNPTGCMGMVSLQPHPAFKSKMNPKYGIAFAQKRDGGTVCNYNPLTRTDTEAAIKRLDNEVRALQRQILSAQKRAAVLREIQKELPKEDVSDADQA